MKFKLWHQSKLNWQMHYYEKYASYLKIRYMNGLQRGGGRWSQSSMAQIRIVGGRLGKFGCKRLLHFTGTGPPLI